MTGSRITDAELPLAAAVIDAIAATAAGDTTAGSHLAARLNPEQAGHAVALLIGIAAGTIDQLAGMTHTPRDQVIRRMRQAAAA